MPQFQKLTPFTAWQFNMPVASAFPEDGYFWKLEAEICEEVVKEFSGFSISHVDIVDTETEDESNPFRFGHKIKTRFNASVAHYVNGAFGSGKLRCVLNEGEWLVENPRSEFGLEVLTDEEFQRLSVNI